jgi:hypothetical protein
MRCKNPLCVLGPDGRPLAGAKVQTNLRPAGSAATVYSGETGGGAGSNPATTDAHGKVLQWLERGAYTSLITAEGMEAYSEAWDSAPGGSTGVDHDWLTVVMREAVDAVPGLISGVAGKASYLAGTHGARPAAAGGPQFYFETDTLRVFANVGSVWRAVQAGAESHYFATGANLATGAEQTVVTPAATLVSWRGRVYGAASGGTSGYSNMKLKRDGSVVAETGAIELCQNNAGVDNFLSCVEYVQTASGEHTWKVENINGGSGFAASIAVGMWSFTG